MTEILERHPIATQVDADKFHEEFYDLHDALITSFMVTQSYGEHYVLPKFSIHIVKFHFAHIYTQPNRQTDLDIEFEGIEFLAITQGYKYVGPTIIFGAHLGFVEGLPYFDLNDQRSVESFQQLASQVDLLTNLTVVGRKCFWSATHSTL